MAVEFSEPAFLNDIPYSEGFRAYLVFGLIGEITFVEVRADPRSFCN